MKSNNINLNDFVENNNYNKSLPSLMLFYNPQCPACVNTKPHWETVKSTLSSTNKHLLNILEFNLQSSNQNIDKLAKLFNIEYIPSIIMMESTNNKNAKIKKLEGSADKQKINGFITDAYEYFMKN